MAERGPRHKLACPYADCAGENPPQARFCATCGRAVQVETDPVPAAADTSGGGALATWSIMAFGLFVVFAFSGVFREAPFLMFLPFVVFAVGVGRTRRNRR